MPVRSWSPAPQKAQVSVPNGASEAASRGHLVRRCCTRFAAVIRSYGHAKDTPETASAQVPSALPVTWGGEAPTDRSAVSEKAESAIQPRGGGLLAQQAGAAS